MKHRPLQERQSISANFLNRFIEGKTFCHHRPFITTYTSAPPRLGTFDRSSSESFEEFFRAYITSSESRFEVEASNNNATPNVRLKGSAISESNIPDLGLSITKSSSSEIEKNLKEKFFYYYEKVTTTLKNINLIHTIASSHLPTSKKYAIIASEPHVLVPFVSLGGLKSKLVCDGDAILPLKSVLTEVKDWWGGNNEFDNLIAKFNAISKIFEILEKDLNEISDNNIQDLTVILENLEELSKKDGEKFLNVKSCDPNSIISEIKKPLETKLNSLKELEQDRKLEDIDNDLIPEDLKDVLDLTIQDLKGFYEYHISKLDKVLQFLEDTNKNSLASKEDSNGNSSVLPQLDPLREIVEYLKLLKKNPNEFNSATFTKFFNTKILSYLTGNNVYLANQYNDLQFLKKLHEIIIDLDENRLSKEKNC